MEFKIGGITVEFSFWFFCVISALFLFSSNNIILLALFFIIIHELSHVNVMILKKEPIQKIVFKPFGVEIVKDYNINYSYKNYMQIYSAGIIINGFLSLVFIIIYINYNDYVFFICSAINFSLFAFNALPISVLDGGVMIKYTYIHFFGIEKGEKIAKEISLLFSGILLILGVILYALGYVNITIIITSIYLFTKNFN